MMDAIDAMHPPSRSDVGSDDDNDDTAARDMHVRTFLEMTDSIEALRALDSAGGTDLCSTLGNLLMTDTVAGEPITETTMAKDTVAQSDEGTCGSESITVKMHAHVIYYGDRLSLSTKCRFIRMSRDDYDMFTRIVDHFKRMLMGTHSDHNVRQLRSDHDTLIKRLERLRYDADKDATDTDANVRITMGREIRRLVKNMLETPVYYTSSCMAMIACGVMLRNLFVDRERRQPTDFAELMAFLRRHVRHNPCYPFACECGSVGEGDGGETCSTTYKDLLSLILEVPAVVHNQTYMLQILAYLLDDHGGREEIFLLNVKNTVSPGILDRIPVRLAMMVGSVDDTVIRRRMAELRRNTRGVGAHLPVAVRGTDPRVRETRTRRTSYNKNTLDELVRMCSEPAAGRIIELLPGVQNASVEINFDRCTSGGCLNADNHEDIFQPKHNNYGRNKCCGYLRLDPVTMFTGSITLVQLCVYLFLQTSAVPDTVKRHYYVRDAITTMAVGSLNMDANALDDMFGYLDHTVVFGGFVNDNLFTSTFLRLMQSYLDGMKNVATRYRHRLKRSKVERMANAI